MGGGMSLHILRYIYQCPSKIIGIFAIGSFLIENSVVFNDLKCTSDKRSPNTSDNLPLLFMHGENDSLINIKWGKSTATQLLLNQINVEFKSYAGLDHDLSTEELCDLIGWINNLLYIQNKNNNEKKGKGKIYEPNFDNFKIKAMEKISDMNNKRANLQSNDKCIVVDGNKIKYTTELISPGQYNIIYSIPLDYVDMVISRPILACGSFFELQQRYNNDNLDEGMGLIETKSITSDIEKTVYEIGIRLMTRIKNEGNSLSPCPIS